MITRIHQCLHKRQGQTALVLILLTAAALIFLSVALNWGRIAQTKSLISIAADQGATTIGSYMGSYGEMEKQQYLKDKNQLKFDTGIFAAILGILIAIVGVVLAVWTGGATLTLVLAALSLVMAVVNLVLQVVVVQPGITSMWNNLQKGQPTTQQFYEQSIITALQGSTTDQVKITDYFDNNANGIFGTSATGVPNDTVSRFALFYTDRLKMLNQPIIPQVKFFYDQLSEIMNGQTCAQNENDFSNFPGAVALNPACAALNVNSPGQQYCINNPIDPACQIKIPNALQLSDGCISASPANPNYSPYCDPCCQPLTVNGKQYRPTTCPSDISASGAPAQCLNNNPFNSSPGSNDSIYTLLYDPSFQNYPANLSFLAKFGRDLQMGPFNSLPLNGEGSPSNGLYFPNGIYPFFWLTNAYSLETDSINTNNILPGQLHWCAAGGTIGFSPPPSGFTDLTQLSLSNPSAYICQGQDCCVNYLADKVSMVNGISTPVTTGGTTNGTMDVVGAGTTAAPNAWVPGDDQMCLTSWPYNGTTSTGPPDGTCALTGTSAATPLGSPAPAGGLTLDNLDAIMHTLSDFVTFSKVFLSNDVGSLSATFDTWYPQAAAWVDPACDDGSSCGASTPGACADGSTCGRLFSVYNPYTGYDELGALNQNISTWMNNNYMNNEAWCIPDQTTVLAGNAATNEYTFITNYSQQNFNSANANWGDLPHVIACLDFNAGETPPLTLTKGSYIPTETPLTNDGPVNNYGKCVALLTPGATCPATIAGTACDPSILGRSLAVPHAPPAYDGCTGSYAAWAQNSLTLATDEAPKFAARAAYLTDVYLRAQTMPQIFQEGETALANFLKPCSGAGCQDGGPAAQLVYAHGQPPPTQSLPNSVIYGWVDGPRANAKSGYAHIVKVTAYSVQRAGSSSLGIAPRLPWVKTSTKSGFLGLPTERDYTLTDRDGPVYVQVKRWDEDHDPILFPNGRPLWTFLFHNPQTTTGNTGGEGLPQVCKGLNGNTIGFGLEPQTVSGLQFANVSPTDLTALGNAFMLNDEVNGGGNVDPNAKNNTAYSDCLAAANQLLSYGVESHACVEYEASQNASECPGGAVDCSGLSDSDYSVKFYACGPQQDDLTYGE